MKLFPDYLYHSKHTAWYQMLHNIACFLHISLYPPPTVPLLKDQIQENVKNYSLSILIRHTFKCLSYTLLKHMHGYSKLYYSPK